MIQFILFFRQVAMTHELFRRLKEKHCPTYLRDTCTSRDFNIENRDRLTTTFSVYHHTRSKLKLPRVSAAEIVQQNEETNGNQKHDISMAEIYQVCREQRIGNAKVQTFADCVLSKEELDNCIAAEDPIDRLKQVFTKV